MKAFSVFAPALALTPFAAKSISFSGVDTAAPYANRPEHPGKANGSFKQFTQNSTFFSRILSIDPLGILV